MRAYKTNTYKYDVACGQLKVIIAYKGDESFHFLLCSLNNTDNQCGCAYSEALANILTFAIRRRKDNEIAGIIKSLAFQRCSKGIRSCPNAIAESLKKAFKEEIKG